MNDDKWLGKYQIPSARKVGWDYSSASWYFVTVCAHSETPPFGAVRGPQGEGAMFRNRLGEAATEVWLQIPEKYPDVVLDEWVVMPDHFHALLWLDGSPLSEIVGRFKGKITWRNNHENLGEFRWQERFHDEIVKYQTDFERIAQYIRDNPKNYRPRP